MVVPARTPAPGPGAVDIPPSLPRLLLVPGLVVGWGLLWSGVETAGEGWAEAVPGMLWLVGGVVLCVVRFSQRRRPVLVLDETGVRDRDGLLLHRWAGTAQVWVGPAAGSRAPSVFRVPSLVVWTRSGLEFGRRAGTGAARALTLAVPTSLEADELAAVVRRCTSAPVLTASEVPLTTLSRRLAADPTIPRPEAVDVPASLVRLLRPALWRLALGLLVAALLLADADLPAPVALVSLLLLVPGARRAHAAVRVRERPVLRVDRRRVLGPDGTEVLAWSDVAALRVGDRPPRWMPAALRVPVVEVVTRRGVDFARRSGTPLGVARRVTVATRLADDELAALLAELGGVRVETGAEVSWRDLGRALVADRR